MRRRNGLVKAAFVPIELTEGRPGAVRDEAAASLAELCARLMPLQLRLLAHRQRLILLVEGWEASGKRGFLRQVLGNLDPCSTHLICLAPTPIGSEDRHWLAKYWNALPGAGHASLFYRSWYRALVDERVLRAMNDDKWNRGGDEINEFEAQQRDHDTIIVKLFFHCSAATLERRMASRLADPWERQLTHEGEQETRDRRDDYVAAWNAAFADTDTRWAPWKLVDAEEPEGAIRAGVAHLVAVLDKALPDTVPGERAAHNEVIDFPGKALR
nr:polyphosphate kinase [Sphingomicrobium astaxanthinifaciens]